MTELKKLIADLNDEIEIASRCASQSRRDEKVWGLKTYMGKQANRAANYWDGRRTGAEKAQRMARALLDALETA